MLLSCTAQVKELGVISVISSVTLGVRGGTLRAHGRAPENWW